MKYAFIVLIAIYLVTYGCSSDKSEETQSSHEQTATTTLENPPHSETAAAPAEQHEPTPPTAAEQHQTAAAEPAAPAQPAEPAADSTTAVPEQAVMPCCQKMAKADAEADQSEQVVMPCGKMMARGDIPENAPCLEMQDMDVMAMPDSDQELSAAMQRMVETTNGVIVATRELVSATYLMLNAGKEVAGEIIESGKDTAQSEGDKQAAEQTPETAPEQEVVETMQQFISAAREVIDATNRAIYSVVAEKKTN